MISRNFLKARPSEIFCQTMEIKGLLDLQFTTLSFSSRPIRNQQQWQWDIVAAFSFIITTFCFWNLRCFCFKSKATWFFQPKLQRQTAFLENYDVGLSWLLFSVNTCNKSVYPLVKQGGKQKHFSLPDLHWHYSNGRGNWLFLLSLEQVSMTPGTHAQRKHMDR